MTRRDLLTRFLPFVGTLPLMVISRAPVWWAALRVPSWVPSRVVAMDWFRAGLVRLPALETRTRHPEVRALVATVRGEWVPMLVRRSPLWWDRGIAAGGSWGERGRVPAAAARVLRYPDPQATGYLGWVEDKIGNTLGYIDLQGRLWGP
jgi:hypothetical protein